MSDTFDTDLSGRYLPGVYNSMSPGWPPLDGHGDRVPTVRTDGGATIPVRAQDARLTLEFVMSSTDDYYVLMLRYKADRTVIFGECTGAIYAAIYAGTFDFWWVQGEQNGSMDWRQEGIAIPGFELGVRYWYSVAAIGGAVTCSLSERPPDDGPATAARVTRPVPEAPNDGALAFEVAGLIVGSRLGSVAVDVPT